MLKDFSTNQHFGFNSSIKEQKNGCCKYSTSHKWLYNIKEAGISHVLQWLFQYQRDKIGNAISSICYNKFRKQTTYVVESKSVLTSQVIHVKFCIWKTLS